MKRFYKERALYGLASQFVTVKIDNTSKEWQGWASKYRHEGRTIPIVYVVRADGKMLYGKSTPTRGNELPELLNASLKQCGRVFNAKELDTIRKTLEKSSTAMDQKDFPAAVKAFAAMKKIGQPGNLQSHAAPAIELDTVATKMMEKAKSDLAEIGDLIKKRAEQSDEAAEVNLAMKIATFNTNFKAFTPLKIENRKLAKAIVKEKSLGAMIKDVESLNKIAKLKVSKSRIESLVKKVNSIAEKYPNSEIEKRAKAIIASLQ